MIDAALARVPVSKRLAGLYLCLLAVAAVAVFAGTWFARTHTLTRTVPVVRAPSNGAALVKAWGKADASVPGEQINPQLAGTICNVYQSRKAIVCYAA